MRAIPTKDCNNYWNIPTGATLEVLEVGDTWSHVSTGDHDGYMMTQYLSMNEQQKENENEITIDRRLLEAIYDDLGNILGLRG